MIAAQDEREFPGEVNDEDNIFIPGTYPWHLFKAMSMVFDSVRPDPEFIKGQAGTKEILV